MGANNATMARARVPAPAATLVALLVAVAMAAATGSSSSSSRICDTAECGRGTCSEVPPGPVPLSASYKCTCDPGWLQSLSLVTVAPCIIPDCSISSDCINPTVPFPPGIPVTDLCVIVDCGHGGECEPGLSPYSYQCRCQPGFKNLLNDNSMPCISDSCTFGADCAKLGLVNTPPPPAPAQVGK